MPSTAAFESIAGVGYQRIHGVDAGVEVVLDFVEVAVVAVGDPGRNVALGDPVHILGRHVQWPDHRIQSGIDAFDDLAVVALVLAGIGARAQLAFHRGFRQHGGIDDECIHGVDAGVEIVFDFVEVAVVTVRDPGRDVTLGDTVHILCRHVQWPDHRIQGGIDAFDYFAVVALVLADIGASAQFALDCGLGQHRGVGQHCVQGQLLLCHVGGEFHHFYRSSAGVKNGVVRSLNPDFFAALADALVLCRLVLAAVEPDPEFLVVGALTVGLIHKHAVVLAFDLIQGIAQGMEEIIVGVEDRPVHTEFNDRLRLADGGNLTGIICELLRIDR